MTKQIDLKKVPNRTVEKEIKMRRLQRPFRQNRRYSSSSLLLANVSLQDLISASRIVVARNEGDTTVATIGSKTAQQLAECVAVTPNDTHPISLKQLNYAIVRRNAIENKPTPKVMAIFDEMKKE